MKRGYILYAEDTYTYYMIEWGQWVWSWSWSEEETKWLEVRHRLSWSGHGHAPHSASSSLPACQQAQLKDNKNKANPLDTTNPEGKEKAFHCRLAIKNYLYIQIYRYIVASRPATRLVTNHQKNLETAFWLSLFLATSLFGVAILSYVYIFFVL